MIVMSRKDPISRVVQQGTIVRNPLKEKLYPFKIYNLYIHLVYKPIDTAKFIVRTRSLREFLRIAKSRGLEQERKDHPLALEFIYSFCSDRSLTDDELREIGAKMIDLLISSDVVGVPFPLRLVSYMDFGVEVEYSYREIPPYIKLHMSRDGITFTDLVKPHVLWRYLL